MSDIDDIEVIVYDESELDINDDIIDFDDLNASEDIDVYSFFPEGESGEEVVCLIGEILPDDFSKIESENLDDEEIEEIDNDPQS